MPIKLSTLKAYSNKPQTTPKIDSHGKPTGKAIKPFIDKLSIVATLPPNHKKDVWEAFWEAADDKSILAPAKSKGPKGTVAKFLVLPSQLDLRKRPYFQLFSDPEAKLATALRIEFVPVDLNDELIHELHDTLGMIVEDGWEFFLKHGRVTRIDIAVDFPGLTMEAFHFLPPTVLSMRSWSRNGELESAVFGKPDSNQTLIYDRGKKRKAHKQSSEGKEGVRLERRLRLNLEVSKLTGISNVFSDLKFADAIPPISPKLSAAGPKSDWQWEQFRDSVQVRGLTQALALVPVERRKIYRQHIAAHGASWWQPAAIWLHWPEALKSLWIK